jgi:hypothetical protein
MVCHELELSFELSYFLSTELNLSSTHFDWFLALVAMSRRLRLSIFSHKDRISFLPDPILEHIISYPIFRPKTPSPQASSQRDGNHSGAHSWTSTSTTKHSKILSPFANSSTPSSPSEIILYQSTHSTLTLAMTTTLISTILFIHQQLHEEFKTSASISAG